MASAETPLGHVDLVEDNDFLRESLSRVLTNAGYRVRTWQDGSSLLDNLPVAVPAVVITDMRMPALNGVDMHAELIRRGRVLPVIYISGESTVEQTIRAMKQGAVDFLIKPFKAEVLLEAVAHGMERDRQALQQVLDQARLEEALQHLTQREREVHALMIKGSSNVEIMDELGISLATTKQYRSQVMRKLGVRTLAQLMAFSRLKGESADAGSPQGPSLGLGVAP